MNAIIDIISILSEEEKKMFLSQLRKKNRRNDTKNIQLFQLLDHPKRLKNPDQVLYGKVAKNSYYALHKRLLDNLINFVATTSFENETSEELDIFKRLLASRIFFEHKKYKIGFKTLLKTEKSAQENDFYSILSEIYQTKLQYAHIKGSEPIATLIEKFKFNQQLAHQEENLTLVYAQIKQQLIQGFATNSKQNISEIITQTLAEHKVFINEFLTFKSLFHLMEMVTNVATAQRSYTTILPFMKMAYDIVLKKPKTQYKHLYYHINILYLMSNVLFRNKEFNRARDYILLMEERLSEQHGKYRESLSGKLVLLQALIANYSGAAMDAIHRVENFINTKAFKNTDIQFQLYLCLLVCYFQQARFKDAYRILRLFPKNEQWYDYHNGQDWIIKKQLIEILLHIEMGNINLTDSRLKSFQNKHYSYLKKINEQRVINFIKLTIRFTKYPEQVETTAFRIQVEKSFDWISPQQEDIYVMSFYAWLKNKMEKGNLYDTTLALIRQR